MLLRNVAKESDVATKDGKVFYLRRFHSLIIVLGKKLFIYDDVRM